MIRVMLDTNILIYATNRLSPEVIRKVSSFKKKEIAISTVTWGEYCVGAEANNFDASAFADYLSILPFPQEAAEIYALLSRKYPQRARAFDRLIAAHAIALGVPLATNNTRDFAKMQADGLRLENWAQPEPEGSNAP